MGEVVARHHIGRLMQLLGLIVTAYSLILFFGDMGPMMRTAAVGIAIFYLGRLVAGKPT